MTPDIIAALRKCRDQFEFYAQEHRIKVDAAVTALDDAKYWGNVDEQDKARKELEKRRKQAATNEEMVVMCDAALSTSPAGQEVREKVARIICGDDPILHYDAEGAVGEELRAMYLEKADAVLAALSSPSVGIAPASSGAGDARIVEWLRGADNSLPDLDSDYASAARQAVYCIDLADAIERGDHLSTPLSHDAEGESATVSREVAEAECENCGEVYGEDPFCPVHGDRAK